MNCKKELPDKQFILSSLFSLEEEELPEDFKDNVHYLLQKESKKIRGFQIIPMLNWKYALAAAILLLFVWTKNIIIPLPEPKTKGKEKLSEQKIAEHQIDKEIKTTKNTKPPLSSTFVRGVPDGVGMEELSAEDKVLKIDLASSEYLKNVQLKITFSENIIVGVQNFEPLHYEIKKDIAHLSPVPTTLLLPVKYLDKKERITTLTFFDEEGEEFAKYSYQFLYSDGNTLQCLLGKEKEVLLTYREDKNIPKVEAIKTDENLSVSVVSGDICFAPVSYENALLVPNLEGKLEMIFADNTTVDITNLQMIVF